MDSSSSGHLSNYLPLDMDSQWQVYAGIIFVGIMWGITNALLEIPASKLSDSDSNTKHGGNIKKGFMNVALDIRFFVPFGKIN
jgi:hypothetical protein